MIHHDAGIQLYSGAFFNYASPETSHVDIEDIAHALSHVCRFAGHVTYMYSVAQHCVNASYIVPEEHAYSALMHDTAEAFTNDLPTPLKFAFPVFRDLEVRIETAMADRFGFEFPLSPEVKLADLQMLKLEREGLKPNSFGQWAVLEGIETEHLDHGKIDLGYWVAGVARARFLARYEELRP